MNHIKNEPFLLTAEIPSLFFRQKIIFLLVVLAEETAAFFQTEHLFAEREVLCYDFPHPFFNP